jgi:hypothetical protein
LFGGVAVVVVAVGAYALLVTTHAVPAQAGFDAATTSLVAVVAMALATMLALAALVVRSPRRRTHLMPVFALATGTASAVLLLAALRAWAAEAPATAPLVAALLALVLCAASALGWLRLWLAPRPGVATAARDAALFEALLSTMVPEGQGLDLAAGDAEIRARVARAFAARSGARRPVLRAVLRVLDLRAFVLHRCGFARLDQDRREALVAALATSRFARLRALAVVLDEIVLTSFYGDARVRAALADDHDWLEARLDAGPNAEAHRTRRAAAARAAAEAQAMAAGAAEPEPVDDVVAVVAEVPPEVSADAPAHEPERPDIVADDAAAQPADTGRPAPSGPATQPAAIREPAPAAPAVEEEPFERTWTLGLPKEPSARVVGSRALRAARAGGPTRP